MDTSQRAPSEAGDEAAGVPPHCFTASAAHRKCLREVRPGLERAVSRLSSISFCDIYRFAPIFSRGKVCVGDGSTYPASSGDFCVSARSPLRFLMGSVTTSVHQHHVTCTSRKYSSDRSSTTPAFFLSFVARFSIGARLSVDSLIAPTPLAACAASWPRRYILARGDRRSSQEGFVLCLVCVV